MCSSTIAKEVFLLQTGVVNGRRCPIRCVEEFMTSNERLEIEAAAFQRMTGRMAPFKDSPAACGPTDFADRCECWKEWREFHRTIILAMEKAFEEHLKDEDLSLEVTDGVPPEIIDAALKVQVHPGQRSAGAGVDIHGA